MQARNITESEMQAALQAVNRLYNDNVCFNRFERKGKHIHFTLRVHSSKGKGAKRGFSGKRTVAACWHVWGDFMEKALEIKPDARFHSSRTGWIDVNGGNWVDFSVGSIMQPMMMSECCECH